MRRNLAIILSLILFLFSLGAASIDKDLITVRDDLFESQYELDNFNCKNETELTQNDIDFYEKTNIYLLTGGPGSLVWENFGHSAFVVELPSKEEISFDYGIFSFDDSFYKNFALGRLYYSVMISYAKNRVDQLINEDRSVFLLELELTPVEKFSLLSFLQYNVQSENQTYLYNYYSDNCATRLRDSYNAFTGGDFKFWAENIEAPNTLREYTKRYLSRSSFPVDWAINYLLGPNVDKRITLWDAMFLPDVLSSAISSYQQNETQTIYESKTRKETPISYNFFLRSLIFSIVLSIPILLLTSKSRIIRQICDILTASIYFVLGVMSLTLLFLMCSSIHDVTYFNENILILNPILLALSILHLVALGKKEKRKGIAKLSFILLVFSLGILAIKIVLIDYMIEENLEYYILAIILYSSDFIINKRIS